MATKMSPNERQALLENLYKTLQKFRVFKHDLDEPSERVYKLLERRYFHAGETSWVDLCKRVAGALTDRSDTEGELLYTLFHDALLHRVFLPNTPCLVNAGREKMQASACFVVPIDDDIDAIFDSIKHTAKIHKYGGGTGIDFSPLRPHGSPVAGTRGISSGPVSFMHIFDAATQQMKQGGVRRGASLGSLRINHPDIVMFIKAKEREGVLSNFNLSVTVTDNFMQNLIERPDSKHLTSFGDRFFFILKEPDGQWILADDYTDQEVYTVKDIWDLIVEHAWKNGEPGVIFIDVINERHSAKKFGRIHTCNPCLTGDTWVITDRGPRQIKDIVGQKVRLAKDGEFYNSSGFFSTGIKPVFKIVTKEGYKIRATANHLFMVLNESSRCVWKKVGDLEDGDRLILSKSSAWTSWLMPSVYKGWPIARVSEIVPDGEEEVFDAVVPGVNSFDANGFIVHNCGETPLLPYEACILGSINLEKLGADRPPMDDLFFARLKHVAQVASLFLNKVIDKSWYPLPEIEEAVKRTRKIGIGVMGFANLLLRWKIKYGTEASIELARQIMKTIRDGAAEISEAFGYRNYSITTIAPTGSLSILAETSAGIEPNFGWTTVQKRDSLGEEVVIHPLAAEFGLDNLPDYFVTASEISPKEHIDIQAAFQEYTDNAVSKTINMPNEATPEDVSNAFIYAYKKGCKGLTIYREGSRQLEVFSKNLTEKRDLDELSDYNESISALEWDEYTELLGLPQERPYCLESFTFKIPLDMGGKIENTYITVSVVDGMPYEVFVYGNVKEADPMVAQYIDTTTRLVSLLLRSGTPLVKVIEQLEKVPCSHMYSISYKVAHVLREFLPDDAQGECPECGSSMQFVEGCMKCTNESCGWSKCG